MALYATSEWSWARIVSGDYDGSEGSSLRDGSGEGFPHHPDLAGHQMVRFATVEAISGWNNVELAGTVGSVAEGRLPDPKLRQARPICAPPPGAATDTRQGPGSACKASACCKADSFLRVQPHRPERQ